MSEEILTVSQINSIIKDQFDINSYLTKVSVAGELSNYKIYPSGHHYFSLKDEASQLKCVMFKSSANSLRFKPENGLAVIATGSVSVYERDGVYQLYCRSITPLGNGDLQIAFEQLKKKLSDEGLFDEDHKIALPQFPKKIVVITSPAGAAVRDILRILKTRWPLSEVLIVPVRVQGDEASGEICKAIRYVNDNRLGDLIITGRGGGSIEDLWAFNEENVARAIYNSDIPVISAVGHEPDVTIADYVADRRASTPSNAAEIAVPDIKDIRSTLETYKTLINPITYIENKKLDFDKAKDKLNYSVSSILANYRNELKGISRSINALSPDNVLKRGYAVVSKNNTVISSSKALKSGDNINLIFSDGSNECIVR